MRRARSDQSLSRRPCACRGIARSSFEFRLPARLALARTAGDVQYPLPELGPKRHGPIVVDTRNACCPPPPASATKQEIMDRVRAMAPRFAERAAAAEEARRIPQESVNDMLEAGLARILIPKEAGGYGLGFDTWFEVTRELSKADASHGWCASLIIHHNHLICAVP